MSCLSISRPKEVLEYLDTNSCTFLANDGENTFVSMIHNNVGGGFSVNCSTLATLISQKMTKKYSSLPPIDGLVSLMMATVDVFSKNK